MTKSIKEKMKGFPTVNYVDLSGFEWRSKIFEGMLGFAGIKNLRKLTVEPFENLCIKIEGPNSTKMPNLVRGAITSHLISIKKWLRETDETYAIFCENDLSIETVAYWNFTWSDFFNSLPTDWECIQLVQIQEVEYKKIKLHKRGKYDWSACCYLLKREYAERLIQSRIKNDSFFFDVGYETYDVESILFEGIGNVYTIPLFLEDVSIDTTATISIDYDKEKDQLNRYNHIKSYYHILDWWRNYGINASIEDLKFC